MKSELVIDLLKVFVKHGVIPQNALRNEEIKITYKEYRSRGISGKEARQLLADKYLTSVKNIESILYGKHNREEYGKQESKMLEVRPDEAGQ